MNREVSYKQCFQRGRALHRPSHPNAARPRYSSVASFPPLPPHLLAQTCQILFNHPSHHPPQHPLHKTSKAAPSSLHPTRCVAPPHAPVSLIHTRSVVGPLCRKFASPYRHTVRVPNTDGQIVVYAVILFGLWNIPGARVIINPLKLFAIGWHEVCHAALVRHVTYLYSRASETSCHIGNTERGNYTAHVHRSHDGRSYCRTGRPSTRDSLRWLYRFLDSRGPVHSRWLRYISC